MIGQWDAGYPQDVVRRGYDYLGPCLTPAEVEAKVKAAREAEREACAAVAQAAALKRGLKRDDAAMRRSISEARRARPVAPPPPPPPPPPFDPNAPVVNPLRLKIEKAMRDGIRDWTAWSIKRNAPLREVLRIVGEIKRERDGE